MMHINVDVLMYHKIKKRNNTTDREANNRNSHVIFMIENIQRKY